MGADSWVALIVGAVGAGIGIWGLVIARDARDQARIANDIASKSAATAKSATDLAQDANTLSHQANTIAEQALLVTKDLGEQQTDLQKQELELNREAARRARLANLVLQLGPRTSRGLFTFVIENRGSHRADDVSVSMTFNDSEVPFDGRRTIAPEKDSAFQREIGVFVGESRMGADGELVVHPELTVPTTVRYKDGEGEKTLKFEVHFPQRTSIAGISGITISQVSDHESSPMKP